MSAPAVRNAEASRARLLGALSDLMTNRGSIDVSVSDIAAEAGLNAALIQYYFQGKSGLYRALFERVAAGALTDFAHLMEMDLSPVTKLRMHIAGAINTYYRYPYLNRLVHHLQQSGDPDSIREVAEFVTRLSELQRRLLDDGEQAGLFVKIDPLLMYFSLMGACDHLFYAKAVLSFSFGVSHVTDELRRRYVDHVTQIVLGGVLKVNSDNVEAVTDEARAWPNASGREVARDRT